LRLALGNFYFGDNRGLLGGKSLILGWITDIPEQDPGIWQKLFTLEGPFLMGAKENWGWAGLWLVGQSCVGQQGVSL